VPAEPVIVIEAVTEPPKEMGLTGIRVGAGTVGVAALTGWILTNAQIDSKISNVIVKICSFFMFFHSAASYLTWIWVNCLLKENVLLALTFPNLIRSEMCIHNKDKVD